MKVPRREWKQRRRAELYGDQNGLCFWCEEPMILLPRYPADGRVMGNICTIDHLRDRDNPTRQDRPAPNEQRVVAACAACNFERDHARHRVNAQEVRT